MDILRKELDSIYRSQNLDSEVLSQDVISECQRLIAICTDVDGDCRVITDASCDRCWIFGGRIGRLFGITREMTTVESSDEDEIYSRIHPEDLVDKRMLEYEFFNLVDSLPADNKTAYKATCIIRMRDNAGDYVTVSNSTQILRLSPLGKIWLILCRYDIPFAEKKSRGISACISNNATGERIFPELSDKKKHILTEREKQVLGLIKEGKPSKIIAGELQISVHTVNRHRQNILEKLNVGNSHEAIMAAYAMKLM